LSYWGVGMKKYLKVCVFLCFSLLVACAGGKQSPIGFSLPEGDAEAGKATFVELACNACHSTPDVEQLETDSSQDITVLLGGDVSRVKTYADLVTSVINPSHRISKTNPPGAVMSEGISRMPVYNSLMTVEQLIDVVTYLQPHYKLRVHEPTSYRGFYP
jgi:L-cysteine S-thiosulfotransferase